MFVPVVFATVVPKDDGQRSADDEDQLPVPCRSQTSPTSVVQAASPPASTRPLRQRAMAQLRPVSIPEIVRDMAGSDPPKKQLILIGTTCLKGSHRLRFPRVELLMHIVPS